MAQANRIARPQIQVPLLVTVALLLDDEGAEVGKQLQHLCQELDPLARSRLRLLRVLEVQCEIRAVPVALEEALLAPVTVSVLAADPAMPYLAPPPAQAALGGADPWAPGLDQPGEHLDIALRGILQEAARFGGAEPLAQRGYRLVPNEVAVYLVGRADSPLLANVARTAHTITQTIAEQTDARRIAFLMAAPLSDDPRGTAPPPYPETQPDPTNQAQPVPSPYPGYPPRYGSEPGVSDWRDAMRNQPWSELLSWQNGEPPLLYTFLFEPWDEVSRYHRRDELRYAMAEALFGLFATGALEHPNLREALDLSTAALDQSNGLERVGSIGTSRITAPTSGMVDYLAHLMTADVLLRRGLLGEAAGMALPDTRVSIPTEARREAERWVRETLFTRLEGEHHPLPSRLPPRTLDSGERGDWSHLAIARVSPDPTGLFWRWGSRQWRRFALDDETFWNIAVQNEYETAGEADQWTGQLASTLPQGERDLQTNLEEQIRLRMLGPAGVDRAQAFADAVSTALLAEQRRLREEQISHEQRIALHHRRLEDDLRRAHPLRGIPTRPNPPPSDRVPLLPRNMEALAHEVIDAAFARVPMPLTVALVAILVAGFGALAIPALTHLPGSQALPFGLYQALTNHISRRWVGATIMLVLFAIALSVPLARTFQLRRWQRRYAEERTLLWLSRAHATERVGMQGLLANLIEHIERLRGDIRGWADEIEQAARTLHLDAARIGDSAVAGATLTRDLFVANGVVWEGLNPDDLYHRVLERQDQEAIIVRFLQYVQAHSGDVFRALQDGSIGRLALDFMSVVLRDEVAEEPFGAWTREQAEETLDRAREAARVLLQPLPAGRPAGRFSAIAIDPEVPWVAHLVDGRTATQRKMTLLGLATPRWALVIRCLTRVRHTLVR